MYENSRGSHGPPAPRCRRPWPCHENFDFVIILIVVPAVAIKLENCALSGFALALAPPGPPLSKYFHRPTVTFIQDNLQISHQNMGGGGS